MMCFIKRSIPALACILIITAAGACSLPIPGAVLTTQVDPSGRPLNSSTVFSVDTPRILCPVGTAGLAATSRMSAHWLYNANGAWKTLKEESFGVAGAHTIIFSINAPAAGWQQGDYAIRLLLDGQEVSQTGFSVRLNENVALPVINNFTATPLTVTSGQPLTLSWNVSGASRVFIEPDIGGVDAGGSRTVTPQADTAYTITALSSGGPALKSVSVQVLPPVTESADLTVVDVFREVSMVYYTVLNNGTASSKPSSANLYVGMNIMASGYIPPLVPGEWRTLVFGTFSWSYANTTPATVCVDTENENGAANAENKCLTRALAGARVF